MSPTNTESTKIRLMKRLQGVSVPMVNPFGSKGEIDEEGLIRPNVPLRRVSGTTARQATDRPAAAGKVVRGTFGSGN